MDSSVNLPGPSRIWSSSFRTAASPVASDGRRAFAGKFLQVHDQAVDRQQTGVLTRLDEGQFLADLRQQFRRASRTGGILFGY